MALSWFYTSCLGLVGMRRNHSAKWLGKTFLMRNKHHFPRNKFYGASELKKTKKQKILSQFAFASLLAHLGERGKIRYSDLG
jgi:hypothetical protein